MKNISFNIPAFLIYFEVFADGELILTVTRQLSSVPAKGDLFTIQSKVREQLTGIISSVEWHFDPLDNSNDKVFVRVDVRPEQGEGE